MSVHVTDALYASALAGTVPKSIAEQTTDALIADATLADSSVWTVPSHEPVVYFVGNGNRVKIGTSTGVRARVASLALRRHHALLVLDGDHALESALHQLFAAERLGNTEWFNLSHRITAFIDAKRGSIPEPTATPLPQQRKARDPVTTDPRRQIVFDLVTKAGPAGIGPAAIIDALRRLHPDLDAPHPDVIARWLGADPRIHKPKHGRYAVKPDQDQQ